VGFRLSPQVRQSIPNPRIANMPPPTGTVAPGAQRQDEGMSVRSYPKFPKEKKYI
jgi:hypothetical protein